MERGGGRELSCRERGRKGHDRWKRGEMREEGKDERKDSRGRREGSREGCM